MKGSVVALFRLIPPCCIVLFVTIVRTCLQQVRRTSLFTTSPSVAFDKKDLQCIGEIMPSFYIASSCMPSSYKDCAVQQQCYD